MFVKRKSNEKNSHDPKWQKAERSEQNSCYVVTTLVKVSMQTEQSKGMKSI